MGVFIHLMVSRSVTQEEWAPVYAEALSLAQKLKLAAFRKVEIGGISVSCLAPVQEETSVYGLFNEKEWTGFTVDGDYASGETCESNSFPKFLVRGNPDPKAIDPLAYAYLDDIDGFPEPYCMLGAKTQGYAHHIPLLAVCCLIQDRLGNKACVFGDITAGQCNSAVKLVNEQLEQPIRLPEQCEPYRLAERIRAIPIADSKKPELMEAAYLGCKDLAFGAAMRRSVGEELCYTFWAERFTAYRVNYSGFRSMLIKYLDTGFDLKRFCRFYSFENDGDKDERRAFIETLLQTGLCDENRKTAFRVIDPEDPRSYGISSLFAQFFFGVGPDKVSNRYIPLEECREILSRGLGCPELVSECINTCLQEDDKSAADVARNALKETVIDKARQLEEDYSNYDLVQYRQLVYYEQGDRVKPELLSDLRKFFAFYTGLTAEPHYEKLKAESAANQFLFFVQNIRFVMRDCDWKKLYGELKADPCAFARYYPAARVKVDQEEARYAVTALILNDELYTFLLEDQAGGSVQEGEPNDGT